MSFGIYECLNTYVHIAYCKNLTIILHNVSIWCNCFNPLIVINFLLKVFIHMYGHIEQSHILATTIVNNSTLTMFIEFRLMV